MTEEIKPENDTTEEAHAYTPGLKVKRSTLVSKTRRLPILGEVFVEAGDVVDYDLILARAELSGDPEIIKTSMLLGIEPCLIFCPLWPHQETSGVSENRHDRVHIGGHWAGHHQGYPYTSRC